MHGMALPCLVRAVINGAWKWKRTSVDRRSVARSFTRLRAKSLSPPAFSPFLQF